MTKLTLQKCNNSKYQKLTSFIYNLLIDKNLNTQIPLSHISKTDWNYDFMPSIYVHNKYNKRKTRRYSRCSNYDIKLAIKFYNKKVVLRNQSSVYKLKQQYDKYINNWLKEH